MPASRCPLTPDGFVRHRSVAPRRPARAVPVPLACRDSHTEKRCGSASGMAPPRTESPSRTEVLDGPSCPLLLNVVMFFGARTAASCTRSITRPRNSGGVYRETHDRNPSRTLDSSLNIRKSTPGRRRGLNVRNILASLGRATCQTCDENGQKNQLYHRGRW